MKNTFFLFTILMAASLTAQPDGKVALEVKKKALQKEIAQIKDELIETRQQSKLTLGEISRLHKMIGARESLLANIKTEINLLQTDITVYQQDVQLGRKELSMLKAQYAQSLVYAYKHRSENSLANFLFSSISFTEMIKRFNYLKSYRNYREKKALDILRMNNILDQRIAALNTSRTKKTTALAEQNEQVKQLEVSKAEKDKAVAGLRSKEKELQTMVARKEKQRQQTHNAIAKIIQQEIKKAAVEKLKQREAAAGALAEKRRTALENEAKERKMKQAIALEKKPKTGEVVAALAKQQADENATSLQRKTTKPRAASLLEDSPAGAAVSIKFEENRNRLPWPVDKAEIVLHYGDNVIPGTKIHVFNDGVTFETAIGAPVKAIFEGVVTSVQPIMGVVFLTVRHGKYFTTYSNLSGTNVRPGNKVSMGQVIGSAAINDDGIGEVTLLVNSEQRIENPEGWIRKR